jgi:CxxC motif-containing protein (DUF1111 family)
VTDSETIRTSRVSVNLLGDGIAEAIADQTLIELARNQCRSTRNRIRGVLVYVPIIEAPGQAGIGRFGWAER